MGRFQRRRSCDSGLPNKRDTPVKTALSRRGKCRRLLTNRHCEAFPEEAEEEEVVLTVKPNSSLLASIKPVHCKPALRLSSPAFTENPRGKAVSPAAPDGKKYGHQVPQAGHSTTQVTPDAEAFKRAEMQDKEEEQNLAVTPESITSSSKELHATFSTEEEDDDDDEEDCYSSTASSSLPSPEIFRKENYVETLTLPIKEELLGLHLHIKNSTLLDVSHAESIHMHHPPNLSAIIDASTILADNNFDVKGPEAENKIYMDSFKSDKAFKWKTPPTLAKRRPILCKKKVCFKSPIIAEIFKAKHIPHTKLTTHNESEPVQTSSPTEHMKPDADTSRRGEIESVEEALRLPVRLKRPVKSNAEKAKFFDFVDDGERDAFFQRMRERCDKLRSAPSFPLTAAKHTELLSCRAISLNPII